MKIENHEEQAESLTLLPQLCHEIRSPLLGMQGLIQKLTEDYAQDLYLVEHLRLLGVSLEQVLSVTENTLTFSQLQQNTLPIYEDALYLPDWLMDVLSLLQPIAKEKNLSLKWQVQLAPEAQWVLADKVRLSQIVNNLVVNALKFTKYGGVSVKLTRVSVSEVADRVASFSPVPWSESTTEVYRLKVSDSGIGMSDRQLITILSDESTKAEEDATPSVQNAFGVGLGLRIVQALVKQMSGKMVVHSQPNEGTQFEVYLPLKVCSPQDVWVDKKQAPLETQLAKQVAHGWRRVLVVDDSAINRKVLENQLLDLGCEVFHARNGEEAVACVHKQPIDVIFMDIQMPVMDGVTAAQQIRSWQSQTPASELKAIYALTAGGEAVDLMDRGRHPQAEALFTQWLSKPISLSQLQALFQFDDTGEASEQEAQMGALPDYLQPLYPEFLQKMATQQQALTEAIERQDGEAVKKIAHGMKGDAMVFQHAEWVARCQHIESLLKQSPIPWHKLVD